MGLLTASQGLSTLQSVLHSLLSLPGSRIGAPSELGASPFSWPRLLSWMRPVPAVYSEFEHAEFAPEAAVDVRNVAPSGPVAARTSWRLEDVAAEILVVVKDVLGAEVGLNEPLMDAGLDSLGAVEFKNAVENRMGVSLPVTAVFDYPTISALAGYIHASSSAAVVSSAGNGVAVPEVQPLATPACSSLRAVIINTAGLASPGLVDGALSFDGIRRVPLGRWDADALALDGPNLVFFGSFVDGAELFDAGLFSVQTTEAVLMDPQQRLLLHFSWDALSGADVDSAFMGVYVGISSSD